MLKWFEQAEQDKTNVVFSRVRLVRNWDCYAFPSKLTTKESNEMITRLKHGLDHIQELDGKQYEYALLGELGDLDRIALKERKVINSAIVSKKTPTGILISDDEEVSLILNGEDHIRLQVVEAGLCLDQVWKKANLVDDYINQRFAYSFDHKYGYLTAFPTNVGTGLKASVVIHLPALSTGRKFNQLVGDMGRFGTSVKGVYGEGSENFGSLYEISNQKTLGQTEKEIIDLVMKVAGQLSNQETQLRQLSLKKRLLERKDEAFKSFGVLKYARRLSMKEAMTFLSQIMAGVEDGLLETQEPCSVYRLMLGIQPANLQKLSDHPLGKEELDEARASYLRMELPELK